VDGEQLPLSAVLGWVSGPELIAVASLQALCTQAISSDVDGLVLGVGTDGERAIHALQELRSRLPDLPLIAVVSDRVPIPAQAFASLGVAEILKRSGLTSRLLAEACARALRNAAGRSKAPGLDPLLLDALTEPAALLDAAGVIVVVNQAWRQFGEENGLQLPNHAVGTNYLDVSGQRAAEGREDGAVAAEGIALVLTGHREEYRQRYTCHAPQERRWFDLIATPVAFLAWWAALVQHRNVTVDEQAQEVARLRERRAEVRLSAEHAILQGILENAPDAIYVKNLEGEFRLTNRAAANLLGRRSEEAIGRRSTDLQSAEQAASAERLDREVIASGESTTREETMESERGPRVLLVTRSPYRGPDGRVVGVIGVAKDITEWRLAEAEVTAKRAHLGRIVEFAPDAMITVNAKHAIIAFNPSAERIFGVRAGEIMGAQLDVLIPERLRAAHRGHLAAFASSGVGARRMEARREMSGLRATGEEFPLEASIMQYSEGDQFFQSVILRDLTERRRIEQALQSAQDEVRQVQKLEAIGKLASGVAHDFNNALTVILASTQIAREDLPSDSPALEELRQIEMAARHAAGLSNQLLAFARRQVLKPASLDLNALVEEVEPMLRRAVGEQIHFQLRLSPDHGSVMADPNQMKQVLMNLVVNARDAMPRGGSLTLETAVSVLHEGYAGSDTAVDPGAYVSLAVSDTGIGMDKATLDRIFEPFFTTKGPGLGTGLGLATSYGIVKQSGGYIWAESQPGQGTTFSVFFPRIESGGPVTTEMAAAPSLAGGNETILLVEDDPHVANVATRALRGGGYSVIAAPGPLEALEVFRQAPGAIDAVVSDAIMPDMDGIELREQLLEIRPDLRVLLVSAYAEGVLSTVGGLPKGVVLLPKPYTVEQLRQAVRRLLT
jgi:PAS domain S-box-containing protein